jgi:hypothetical protein
VLGKPLRLSNKESHRRQLATLISNKERELTKIQEREASKRPLIYTARWARAATPAALDQWRVAKPIRSQKALASPRNKGGVNYCEWHPLTVVRRQRVPVFERHRLALSGSRWDIRWVSGGGKTWFFCVVSVADREKCFDACGYRE